MSLTEDWTYGKTESGSHVGVVKTLLPQETNATFYVNATDIHNQTKVLILATTYNATSKLSQQLICNHQSCVRLNV